MPAFTGTSGADTLNGSLGADTLTGLAGNDTYIVNSIGDVVIEAGGAGSGIDTIRTSVRDGLGAYSLVPWSFVENLVYTGAPAAVLRGNALGNDIRAHATAIAHDTLYGGGGGDTLSGYRGNDWLHGGAGNDVIDGGAGIDNMIGGAGNDTYTLDNSGDRVYEYAGGGADRIVSTVAKDLRASWALHVENLTWSGAAAATLFGNDLGNAVISLSAAADILHGNGGDDTLNGGGGSNALLGGLGNDLYQVGAADTVTEAEGEGIDTLAGLLTDLGSDLYATTVENLFYTGAAGAALGGNVLDNLVRGGGGNDTISGQDGNDSLLGGAGADSVVGGSGNDFLYGAGSAGYDLTGGYVPDAQADTLSGGAGDDRYRVDDARDVIVELLAGGTFDVVVSATDASLAAYNHVEALLLQDGSDAWYGQGSSRSDVIVGNDGDNHLAGGAGNDTLSAAMSTAGSALSGSDVLDGGGGNDVLIAFGFGAPPDWAQEASLFGGTGNDLYVIGNGIGRAGGTDAGGIDTAVLIGSASIENLAGVEKVVLFGANNADEAAARAAIDKVYSVAHPGMTYQGAYANTFDATGNALANTITGNLLDNLLDGLSGSDTLIGGAGDDTLQGGAGNDRLVGGGGDDVLYAETGDTVVELAGGGYDILFSGTINDVSTYANVEGLRYLGSVGQNLDRGSTNTSNDYFGGGAGNDTVSGYGGNDTLEGFGGSDRLLGGTGADTLAGGGGNDTAYGGSENDRLSGDDGNDTLVGELGDDMLLGGTGDDVLDGGGNFDTLDGGAGADNLDGGAGNDVLLGGSGADVLSGGDQNDVLVGGAGDDTLSGGGQASDTGNFDLLWGDDSLASGIAGADTFLFDVLSGINGVSETFNGSGVFQFRFGAVIADFDAGMDTLAVTSAFVGDLDALLENAQILSNAGATFDATAEMVVYRADVAVEFAAEPDALDGFLAAPLDDVIGNADATLAVNSTKLFVVDDGASSAVFVFQSADGNAAVTIDELYLLGVVYANPALSAGDFSLF